MLDRLNVVVRLTILKFASVNTQVGTCNSIVVLVKFSIAIAKLHSAYALLPVELGPHMAPSLTFPHAPFFRLPLSGQNSTSFSFLLLKGFQFLLKEEKDLHFKKTALK